MGPWLWAEEHDPLVTRAAMKNCPNNRVPASEWFTQATSRTGSFAGACEWETDWLFQLLLGLAAASTTLFVKLVQNLQTSTVWDCDLFFHSQLGYKSGFVFSFHLSIYHFLICRKPFETSATLRSLLYYIDHFYFLRKVPHFSSEKKNKPRFIP